MQSIAYIPASNGAGNANQMTVQTVRSPGASDILVNTVTGAPNKFYASMGAPHTFTDPVTGETITIISEATAVDFAGHIDSGKVVIDAIAPGYVDTRGSLVGDIVVIRPLTEWANNLFNILSEAHNDDGTLKNTSLDAFLKPSDIVPDCVSSGGVVAISSGLTGTLSDMVYYIGGLRYTKTGIPNKTYTASRHTYIYIDAAGTITYTETAIGAAVPSTPANNLLVAMVTTGASYLSSWTKYNRNTSNDDGWEVIAETTLLTVSADILYAFLPTEKQAKRYKILSSFERTSSAGSLAFPRVQINQDTSSIYQTKAMIVDTSASIVRQDSAITNIGEVSLAATIGAGGTIEATLSRALSNGWWNFIMQTASDTYTKVGGGRWNSGAIITNFTLNPTGVINTVGTYIMVMGKK